jgi:ketosteroid isomerase-like protein
MKSPMKRWLAFPALISLCAAMVFAQKPAASLRSAEEELKQIEKSWSDAQMTRNVDALRDILATDWVGVGWDGAMSDTSSALADLKAPGNSLQNIEMGPMTVRIFGNTAVVTGTDVEKSTEHGKDSSGKYIWTDVFVKQKGKWKAVASQSAKMAE